MGEHIIFIGFMGAGKTTVGRAAAKALDRRFLDTDRLIEEKAGMTISRMFETLGEAAFREEETRMLMELLNEKGPAVISVGGGLPLRRENRRLLRMLGNVVYLRVRPDTVWKRLDGDATRPLLQGKDAVERVKSLLGDRGPLYEAAARLVVDVDGKTVGQIIREVEEKIRKGME